MSDVNPYAAPHAEISAVSQVRPQPQSLSQAIRHGAWTGFKWATYIAGPIAIFGVFLLLLVIAFEFAVGMKGHDYKTLIIFLNLIGFYATSCMWGVIIGAVLAPIGYLLRRGKTSSSS